MALPCYNGTSFANRNIITAKNGLPCTGCFSACVPSQLVGISQTALTSVAMCLANGNTQPSQGPLAGAPGVYCSTPLCNAQDACKFVPPAAPSPVPNPGAAARSASSSGLSGGAITGIVVGVVAFCIFFVIAVWPARSKRANQKRHVYNAPSEQVEATKFGSRINDAIHI